MVNSELFRKQVSEQLGRGPIRNLQALSGGDINAAYQIHFQEGPAAFLKFQEGAKLDFFQAEADGLNSLKEHSPLKVPEVLGLGEWEQNAYLLLEFLEPGFKSDEYELALGEGLAQMHLREQDFFGWHRPNYIGKLDQLNHQSEDWTDFYAEHRILYMVQKAFDAGYLETKDLKGSEAFVNAYPHLVPTEKPAFIHGDLWSGNAYCMAGGIPVLIDPAVYNGHREMDLAMMKLFGGFSVNVFQAYEESYPLERGWQERIPYHQLYPLLVHLNLFGTSYLNDCRSIWQKFL
ncbi:fructosamine kinase family protein [Croceimicrobium sp.]|uniref:fructosamine kinase family protein n=1 Tax=Croceimicrobium sp. TaxID=2828340 RepID=UPI003BABCB15